MEKEYKKDYAVLYKKEIVSEDYHIYLLKPCYVVEGFYDKKNNVFLDELNEERLSCTNSKLVNTEDEFCVGMIFSEDELLEKYSQARNVDEAKIRLSDDAKDNAMISVYDFVKDEFNILRVDLESLSETISNSSNTVKQSHPIEFKEDMEDYDDEEFEFDLDEVHSSLESIDDLDDSDVYYVKLDDVDKILAMQNLDDIREKLSYIKYNNDEFKPAAPTLEALVCIEQDTYEALLETDDITLIKRFLFQIKNTTKDLLKSLEETRSVYDDIIQGYDLVYAALMSLEEIDEMKDCLASLSEPFRNNVERILDDGTEEYYSATLAFSKIYLQEIAKMLICDDLSLIKESYHKLYTENQELLKAYALELSFASQMEDIEEEKKTKEEREEKQKQYEELFNKDQVPSYRFDYMAVHDKMVARVIGRDTQIDSILTTIERNDKVKNPSKRSAMIIAGTTGTGKTQTFTELKNALSDIRPVNIVDTNQITSEGYVGGTIEDNILASLIIQAHSINEKKNPNAGPAITANDVNLAQHGIVILDEIDKRAEVGGRGDNVNKSGVVHQLLKLMDPSTKYIVKVGKQSLEFDTSTLTIFASGAFQEYFDELEHKKAKPTLGFTSSAPTTKEKAEYEKYNEVDPNELVKYGLDRQFVGRFNRVTLFPSHTKESLLELETNKATSNLQVEIDEYEEQGISFLWEDGFVEKAVEKAYEMKTGGRALANIINRSLGNLNVEVNNRKGMFKAIFVPIKALEDPSTIMLVKENNDTVLLRELYAESKKKNDELKIINKIVRDEKSYEKVKQLYDYVFQSEDNNEDVKVKQMTN